MLNKLDFSFLIIRWKAGLWKCLQLVTWPSMSSSRRHVPCEPSGKPQLSPTATWPTRSSSPDQVNQTQPLPLSSVLGPACCLASLRWLPLFSFACLRTKMLKGQWTVARPACRLMSANELLSASILLSQAAITGWEGRGKTPALVASSSTRDESGQVC